MSTTNERSGPLGQILAETETAFDEALRHAAPRIELEETGTIASVGQGIARVRGLPNVQADELVLFADDTPGIAFGLDGQELGVVVLGESDNLAAGSEVRRTRRRTDTPVGPGLLGRVVDATGRALDGKGAVASVERRPVERDAPAIMDRAPVTVPMQTGIKSVDALIPIGRGQRELIVGDRQTGKTAVAVDTIINQNDTNVISIYCAIGQRGTAVARVIDALRSHGAMDRTIVVVAAGEDPPGLQFVTPYAAMTIGEYFMEQGRDVLLVLDDLTRHARGYRELSLLLRRPPGREAYPGDIFYIHSRLLERATHLSQEQGAGSLTALPVVETQAQDISAYIPTNLISITDGQIYLSPNLFQKGLMPAVDIGKSVSRVGGKTQLPAYRAVAGDLRLAYSQFEELEAFARFATRLDEDTRATIERGRRVREIFKQAEHQPLAVADQIAVLAAVNAGVFDALELTELGPAQRAVHEAVREQHPKLCRRIEAGEELNEDEWRSLHEAARRAVQQLAEQPEA